MTGPHSHALPCWQPHAQDARAGAADWQPQVHAAPMQALHAQAVARVFMAWVFMT
jgi:hypothetical protein